MGMKLELSCNNTSFTANIFYRILCDAIKNKRAPGDNYNGATEKLTQTHLFYDLNLLIDPAADSLGKFDSLLFGGRLQGGQKNAAKKFKYGEFTARKSDIYRFNNTQIKIEFDHQVKSEFSKTCEKAVEFARRYFDVSNSARNTALVQKVLFLIFSDASISESQEFYICSNGSTKTKADLRSIDTIEFEAFLLGVWHYLIISQKLQADLKGITEISVNMDYKHIKVNLIYNDLQKTQTEFATSTNGNVEEKSDDENNGTNKNGENNTEQTQPTLVSNEEQEKVVFKSKYDIANPGKAKRIVKRPKEGIKHSFVPDDDPSIDFDDYPSEIDYNTDIISVLKNNDIQLSRGIFFYLLTQSIQTVHPKRNINVVERLFLDMLNLTVDNSCNIDLSQSHVRDHHDNFRYLKELCSADCLDDAASVNDFLDRLHTDYDEFLSDMIKIRKKYFNSGGKNEVLIVALIEFIRNDDSIDDCQEFFVCSDGTSVTKTQLCDVEEMAFEPFLLGVWHYVVSQLDSKDSADEYTFDTVFKVSYKYNGKDCTRYRSGDLIEEQSELYVELTYLEE